ncbi:MBL fold metallo-hydrolase [Methanoregula sp.]|uniref:MBL fold metallo-hydrolase n=1 Tax=Methanoregula sp. TaxID=2052170 RepID=UPI002370BD6A|nr:MBL fold metallo-hydrolase [Methanoregula sp.]MDD1687605.1 lamin tail domain-containing protein [Methanoregula sp.]
MQPEAAMRPLSRSSARVSTVIAVLLVLVLVSAGCTSPQPGALLNQNTTGDLHAYFLDVGQGDSSVILFRDKVILIDAGETDRGDTVVSDLKKLGVTKIDLLVATHPHSDHIGGMQKVLVAFPVGKVLDTGMPSTSSLYEHFLETVDEKNIPYIVAESGQNIDIDPALGILVLSPPKERIGDDINTNSIVLRISYGTMNLLYAGDATAAAEEVMTKTGYPLDARVLKVGHHGSSGSSSAAFLARVNPDVAVISLGKDNDYAHPHTATLERLATVGSKVFRTDRDGTVRVVSDGSTFSVTTEKGDSGFWNAAVYATTPSPKVTVTNSGTAIPLPAITLNATGLVPDLSNISLTNVTIPVTLPPVQIGNASSIVISATQFNAPGDDRENLNGEWVRITNRGSGSVLIAGWTLSDKTGSHPYTFPAVVLIPSTSVTVFTGSGTMNDTALYMGQSTPVWGNSGDVAILRDGTGKIIDEEGEDIPA